MMMAFGQFVFSLPTLAYQDLQRQTTWRHPSNSRVGARPARQFLGAGDDTITLSGVLAPEFAGDPGALNELREMGGTGNAWPLVDGAGYVYGQFVLESLAETQTIFMDNGTARRYDFTISLARVDDDGVDSIGESSSASSAAGDVVSFDE